MEDSHIVDLYWARSEHAVVETKIKYERMLLGISYSLLSSHEDAEECVSDTYIAAWRQMPTDRPTYLGAYLSKITRRISIGRFRSAHRQKRGGFENLTLELCECIPDSIDLDRERDSERIRQLLDGFLREQPKEKRVIFLRRYFYSDSVEKIAERLGISESKVKTTLFRMRTELRKILEKEELL